MLAPFGYQKFEQFIVNQGPGYPNYVFVCELCVCVCVAVSEEKKSC